MTDKTMTLEQVPAALRTIAQYVGTWEDEDIAIHLRRIAVALETQTAERGEAVQPFGYAFRYPDGIRFNTGGREINGCKPSETIPLYTALPPAAGVPDAWPKLELWFFRELSSAQRLSLLDLHGFPVDEIGESHVWQKNALRQLLSATPSLTTDIAAVRDGDDFEDLTSPIRGVFSNEDLTK